MYERGEILQQETRAYVKIGTDRVWHIFLGLDTLSVDKVQIRDDDNLGVLSDKFKENANNWERDVT